MASCLSLVVTKWCFLQLGLMTLRCNPTDCQQQQGACCIALLFILFPTLFISTNSSKYIGPAFYARRSYSSQYHSLLEYHLYLRLKSMTNTVSGLSLTFLLRINYIHCLNAITNGSHSIRVPIEVHSGNFRMSRLSLYNHFFMFFSHANCLSLVDAKIVLVSSLDSWHSKPSLHLVLRLKA